MAQTAMTVRLDSVQKENFDIVFSIHIISSFLIQRYI